MATTRNETIKQSGTTSGYSTSFDATMSALDTGQSWFSGTPYSSYISQMISAGESLESGATGLIANETNAWSQLSNQVNQITQLNPGASRTEAADINTSLKNSLGNFADSTMQNRELLRENTRSFYEGVGDLISDTSFAQTAGNKLWYEMDGSSKEKYEKMNNILNGIGENKYLDVFFSDRELANRDANEAIDMYNQETNNVNGLFSDDWVDSFTNDSYDKIDRKYNRGFLGTLFFGSTKEDGRIGHNIANAIGHGLSFLVWEPLKFMTFDLANNTADFLGSVVDGEQGLDWGAGIGAALGAVSWIPFVRGGKVASTLLEHEAITEVEALGANMVNHLTKDGMTLLTDAAVVGDSTFAGIESHLDDFSKSVNESFKKTANVQSLERKASFGKTAKKATREATLEREALDKILAPNGRTKRGLQKQGKTTLSNQLHRDAFIEVLSMPSAELETKIATHYGETFAKEVTNITDKLKADFAKEITSNKKLLDTLMKDGTFGKTFNLKTLSDVSTGRAKKAFKRVDRTQQWKSKEAERLYKKGTNKLTPEVLEQNAGNQFSVLSNKKNIWKDVSTGAVSEAKYSDALLNKLYDNPAIVESKLSMTLADNSARYTKMSELHTAEKATNDISKVATKGAKKATTDGVEAVVEEVKQTKWGKFTGMLSKAKDKRAIKKGEKISNKASRLEKLRTQNMDKMKSKTGFLGRERINFRIGRKFGKRSLIPFKNMASFTNMVYGGLTMEVANQLINYVELASESDGFKKIDSKSLWLDFLGGYDLESEWEWGTDKPPYQEKEIVTNNSQTASSNPNVRFNLKF